MLLVLDINEEWHEGQNDKVAKEDVKHSGARCKMIYYYETKNSQGCFNAISDDNAKEHAGKIPEILSVYKEVGQDSFQVIFATPEGVARWIDNAKIMKESTLFCQELDGRNGKWFGHFFNHPRLTMMCGKEPVHRVIVRQLPEIKDGCYWAFWSNQDLAFCNVYPTKSLVDMFILMELRVRKRQNEGILLPVEIIDQEVVS